MCHTFYHVLITFLKEFKLRAESAECECGDATLVLSLMSNDFGGLKNRIEKTGFFKEVLELDEKRETFYPELAEYKIDRGNLVSNMIQRIRFTSKFAKLLEQHITIDFGKYRDIYVFCDTDPIGLFLNKHHIRYHAMEDGLDCLKTLDLARISNAGHFELKALFAKKAKALLDKGVKIEQVNGQATAFTIQPADGSYKVNFGDAEFEEYFKAFLRPQLVEMIF